MSFQAGTPTSLRKKPASVGKLVALTEEQLKRIDVLRRVLQEDLLGCDAKWALFVAAANSHRYDILLRPIPPRFISETQGIKINSVAIVINNTPKLSRILQLLTDECYDQLYIDVLELLHWVLVSLPESHLRAVKLEKFDQLLSSVRAGLEAERPTSIFEICPQVVHSAEKSSVSSLEGDYRVKLAFYSDQLEAFFLLINHGFQYNIHTTTPLTLTQNFADALMASKCGAAWGTSECGSIIQCVGVCEVTDDPQMVKWQENRADPTVMDAKIFAPELARLRYLIFYGSRVGLVKKKTSNWMSRYRYPLIAGFYVSFLLSVAFVSSRKGAPVASWIIRKIQPLLAVRPTRLAGSLS